MSTETSSCLVLGGGGFIGAHLCRHLAKSGHQVTAFGHSFTEESEVYLSQTDAVVGDFTKTESLASLLDQADVVFHLISVSSPGSILSTAQDVEANVVSTLRLLDECTKRAVERVIFVSSGGTIYGDCQSTPISETAPTEPISSYAITKLTIEKYLALYRRQHGLRSIVLRVANPFGPLQSPMKRQGLIAGALRAVQTGQPLEIWGDGSAVRDYVHIDDVVRALVKAVSYSGLESTFNIGSGIGRSVNEVIGSIEEEIGEPVPRQYVPQRTVDVASNVLDVSKAASLLNWRAQSDWRAMLRETAAWVFAPRLDESISNIDQ